MKNWIKRFEGEDRITIEEALEAHRYGDQQQRANRLGWLLDTVKRSVPIDKYRESERRRKAAERLLKQHGIKFKEQS